MCDAPTLLYALLALGLGQEAGVQAAVAHLASVVDETGWRCRCGPERIQARVEAAATKSR